MYPIILHGISLSHLAISWHISLHMCQYPLNTAHHVSIMASWSIYHLLFCHKGSNWSNTMSILALSCSFRAVYHPLKASKYMILALKYSIRVIIAPYHSKIIHLEPSCCSPQPAFLPLASTLGQYSTIFHQYRVLLASPPNLFSPLASILVVYLFHPGSIHVYRASLYHLIGIQGLLWHPIVIQRVPILSYWGNITPFGW